MGANSKIEWTDASWNPIRARRWIDADVPRIGWHCTHVSEGCRNCYAETMNRRLGTGLDYKPGHEKDIELFLDETMLLAPLRWRRPRKIFVGSMTDLFADFVTDDMLDRVFAVMALCPQHTFQLLTKRPERMRKYLSRHGVEARTAKASVAIEPLSAVKVADMEIQIYATAGWDHWPRKNIWLGTSCEDQPTADERIPHLLATPAAVRFLSCEPLLGPINLAHAGFEIRIPDLDGPIETNIDWIICGGESGPHARPMHPDWARSLRDQCAAADVAFHFKQHGEHIEIDGPRCRAVSDVRKPTDFWLLKDGSSVPLTGHRTSPTAWEQSLMRRVGKKNAGRLLDGVEHNAFPEAQTLRGSAPPRETLA